MTDQSTRRKTVSSEHPLAECDTRILHIEDRLDEHSDRFEHVTERLQKGEVLFTEIKKDMERLTDEVKGIKTVLVWIGGVIAAGVIGVAGSALLWAIRSMPLVVVAVVLTGCVSNREERQEVERASETLVVQPVQIDTPIGQITVGPVQAQRQEARERRSETQSETTVPAAQALVGAASSLGSVGTGGGLVGLASGTAGLLAGAFAWWRKRQSDFALKQTVEGIEEAKDKLPPESTSALLDELRKAMDESTKDRVRKARSEV